MEARGPGGTLKRSASYGAMESVCQHLSEVTSAGVRACACAGGGVGLGVRMARVCAHAPARPAVLVVGISAGVLVLLVRGC